MQLSFSPAGPPTHLRPERGGEARKYGEPRNQPSTDEDDGGDDGAASPAGGGCGGSVGSAVDRM